MNSMCKRRNVLVLAVLAAVSLTMSTFAIIPSNQEFAGTLPRACRNSYSFKNFDWWREVITKSEVSGHKPEAKVIHRFFHHEDLIT
ncbi:MAG: hypothetical protein WBL68_08385 [Nitrososphaeraceae archaeon]